MACAVTLGIIFLYYDGKVLLSHSMPGDSVCVAGAVRMADAGNITRMVVFSIFTDVVSHGADA